MDRHFAAVQKTIASTPALADVRLVTMTLDPAFDTPAVLKPYAVARRRRPDDLVFPDRRPGEVTRVRIRSSASTSSTIRRAAIDITHNLRTVVIDADGRLVKVHTGNPWTPVRTRCRSHRGLPLPRTDPTEPPALPLTARRAAA